MYIDLEKVNECNLREILPASLQAHVDMLKSSAYGDQLINMFYQIDDYMYCWVMSFDSPKPTKTIKPEEGTATYISRDTMKDIIRMAASNRAMHVVDSNPKYYSEAVRRTRQNI